MFFSILFSSRILKQPKMVTKTNLEIRSPSVRGYVAVAVEVQARQLLGEVDRRLEEALRFPAASSGLRGA